MVRQAKQVYEFGPFRLDAAERVLTRDGHPVPLTQKAIETLIVLVENSGHIVEKDDLLSAVWADSFVEENVLSVNIFKLRKALGDEPSATRFIETVPKRGYRFVAPVVVLRGEGAEPTTQVEAVSNTAVKQTVVRSMAVLPFNPLSADGIDEYLGLGIADSLITRLGNIRQVIVRPTSSVRRYIGLEQDPVVAGRELEVESVLEGSIRESGERIRVTVQLVSVSDRSTLWADKFDEKLTDIFAVEDSISERVAEALRLELTGEERKRLTKRYTENAEAYQLYLRGRYHWNKRAAEELRKGIEHFQQAIDGDPNYALAWAGLADCYVLLSYWGGVAPKDCLPKAKAAALRAVELDDHLAEAHASLAMVKRNYEWDFPGTEGELRRALELKPHYATAHHWYGDHLTTIGRLDEGMAELRRAQELDPLSLVINSRIGLQWLFMRRYTEAVAAFQSALDLDPRFYPTQGGLGLAYAQTGRHEEATSEINKARALTDAPHLLALLGITYALSGRKSKARQVIAELQEVSQRLYVSPYHIAWVYAALGEKDHAFTWLEQAYEDRTDWLLWVKVEPLFDCLRADPRFADLVRRVGLEP